MQLPVAEDLLRNTENLAIVIGDVLKVTSENISDSNATIIGDNIGMPNTHMFMHVQLAAAMTISMLNCIRACIYAYIHINIHTYMHKYIHTCLHVRIHYIYAYTLLSKLAMMK